ncbi:hypothetical protein J3R83DRAFT_5033 [Lanmaoa asiatica]|nr:hypothetical protein J3R83DRAFT_5033 [Lanmaoa asiatica]
MPVTNDIQSSPLAISFIMSDVHTWLIPVQKHLMSLLGYPNGWQSASTRMLPPLKRLTARFFCRKCGEGQVGRGYQRELSLDLKGVCLHVCVAAQRKNVEGRRREAPQENETDAGDSNRQEKEHGKGEKKSGVKTSDWTVDVFEKDEKAIRVIKTILDLMGLSEGDPSTASKLNAGVGNIRCMTCKGWIVMDFDTAIGHAHRHESMEIQLLTKFVPSRVVLSKKDASAPNGNALRTIPNSLLAFERGTSALLLGPARRARHLCSKANYGCKHCFLVEEGNIAVGIEKPGVGAKGKGARAMDFNALRSHAKEKHGIQDIRDEDYFCYTPI